ncbi:MAG: GtrA family protein [Pseudomonadota bacterium]
MNHQLLGQFGRFAFVGAIGFFVDMGTTLVLIALGIDPLLARIVAIVLAMLTTWRLNRAMTFGPSPTSQVSEGLRYLLVAMAVAACNYAIYAALLLNISGLQPAVAVLISTGFATGLSFFGYRKFAFKTNA